MKSHSKINCCNIPKEASQQEAEIYNRIRDMLIQAHCANKNPAHKCAGLITINNKHITFQCPICGDVRQII